MNLILLGAPGAGKGTQAETICKHFGIPAISTGNIIREALRSGTEMGLRAKQYTEAGQLVPDEVVIGIVAERLSQDDCKAGFLLDGFPRTIPQAEALDKMGITIDKVVDIDVPDGEIVQRMSGRRVCSVCGASYHIVNKKPKVEGVCDLCSGALVQRKDDHPDTVKERLSVYHEKTEPLKAYYEKQNKVFSVNGCGAIDEISNQIISALEALV